MTNPQAKKEQGLVAFIYKLLGKKEKKRENLGQVNEETEIHLEPKYWPEVRHFIDTLNHIIEAQTINDHNLRSVNQRIVDYVEKQINIKGSLDDIEARYIALDTLADRILVKNLGKIVGLKHNENTRADFSEAIKEFKKQLHNRHKEEVYRFSVRKQ